MDSPASYSARPRSRSILTLPILVVVSMLVLSSCRDSISLFQPIPEPSQFRNATLPLAVGNAWQYADTANSVLNTWTDSIARFRVENDLVWWSYANRPGEIAILEGMVLARNYYTWSLPQYIPTPPRGDTTYLDATMPGDSLVKVYALSGTFTVPAGTFDSCAVYESRLSYANRRVIFKPGIGVLYVEYSSNSGSTYRDAAFLQRYSLKR